MSWLDDLRQWVQPKEFRISQPQAFPGLQSELQQLMKAISEIPEPEENAPAHTDEAHGKFLADLGTRLWRLRNRMAQPNSNEALPGMERPYRFFESVWNSLAREKIDVVDYTDQLYNPGIPMEIISHEKKANLTRKTIIETIKPAIFYKDKRIQIAQVIVGIPENE